MICHRKAGVQTEKVSIGKKGPRNMKVKIERQKIEDSGVTGRLFAL